MIDSIMVQSITSKFILLLLVLCTRNRCCHLMALSFLMYTQSRQLCGKCSCFSSFWKEIV